MEKIGHLEIRVSGTKGNLELKPDTLDVRESTLQFVETSDHQPHYDADYLTILRKKAMGWLNQINAEEWLREIRGDYDA